MVSKLAGFLSGAGAAAIGLFAWSTLTTVSDEQRLESMLTACLDYVVNDTAPFAGQGRPVGGYDAPVLEGEFTPETHRIVDDDRFEVAWEVVTDAERPTRVCRIAARYIGATDQAFEVEDEGFVVRLTGLISEFEAVQPEGSAIGTGPRSFGWQETGQPQNRGLRVFLLASPGMVSSVHVANEIDS